MLIALHKFTDFYYRTIIKNMATFVEKINEDIKQAMRDRRKEDLSIFRNFIKEQYYRQLNSEIKDQNNRNLFLSF